MQHKVSVSGRVILSHKKKLIDSGYAEVTATHRTGDVVDPTYRERITLVQEVRWLSLRKYTPLELVMHCEVAVDPLDCNGMWLDDEFTIREWKTIRRPTLGAVLWTAVLSSPVAVGVAVGVNSSGSVGRRIGDGATATGLLYGTFILTGLLVGTGVWAFKCITGRSCPLAH